MRVDDAKLQKVLLDGGYVTKEDIAAAQEFVKSKRGSVSDYFLSSGLMTPDLLGQAVAESFNVPYADLNSNQPSKDFILRIPEETAKKHRAVLFEEGKKEVTVTTDDPESKTLKTELKSIFKGKTIKIAYSLSEDIDACFVFYQKPLETRFSKIISGEERIAPEILEEIFGDAYTFHASDIHFEPQGDQVLIRFRVDGILREAGRLPKEYYQNLLNRIKVQSRLRIDEHFAAQDGSMRVENEQAVFDMRTSIVPTVEGEKVVLRLLASYVKGFSLTDLGLSATNRKILEEAARKPFGMILVVGPTGSGKSTTLYAVLKMLMRPEINVTTIEDPVEYKLVGANQIQVNNAVDLTFAKGLRSIVRQDPDIVLVGEIRDTETAEIAVNAALTGHLLLSTFHANDAATAMPRLLDMGVEPFLLASTLNVIIAQRLVRKICESCRYSVSMTPTQIKQKYPNLKNALGKKSVTLYAGKGCEKCSGSGFRGRTAIFEFIRVTPELQELALKHPSTREIWQLAKKQGALSLFEDGLDKVKNGVTTVEELMRVASLG